MKALITGGSGFIGWHVVKELLSGDYETVTVFDLSPPKQALPNGVHFFKGDITDYAALAVAVHGVDTVFHLAAQIWFSTCPPVELMHRVNVEGTRNVVRACREAQVSTLVHVSSIDALNAMPEGFFSTPKAEVSAREVTQHPTHFLNGVYGETKALAEKVVLKAPGEFKRVIIRTGHVCGVGDVLHADEMVAVARMGFMVKFWWGNDLPPQHLVYVEDVARACVFLAQHSEEVDGEAINVAGDPDLGWEKNLLLEWSKPQWEQEVGVVPIVAIPFCIAYYLAWAIESVTAALQALFGLKFKIVLTRTAIHGTACMATYSVAKLKNLGFEWKWSFEQGLKATLESRS